jgi:hypothetical protein
MSLNRVGSAMSRTDGLMRPKKDGLSLLGVARASAINFCAIMRRANPCGCSAMQPEIL